MTQWIHNWKKNNWKTASGGPVKNKEDLQKLDTIVTQFVDVKWVSTNQHYESLSAIYNYNVVRYAPNHLEGRRQNHSVFEKY